MILILNAIGCISYLTDFNLAQDFSLKYKRNILLHPLPPYFPFILLLYFNSLL